MFASSSSSSCHVFTPAPSSSSVLYRQHHQHHHNSGGDAGSGGSGKISGNGGTMSSSVLQQTQQRLVDSQLCFSPPSSAPTGHGAASESLNIHDKLRELFLELLVEDCSESDRLSLRNTSFLLEKLILREQLNTLIVNLYPGNKGYSLAFRIGTQEDGGRSVSKSGSSANPTVFSSMGTGVGPPSTAGNDSLTLNASSDLSSENLQETIRWPYEEEDLLDSIDREELPLVLVDILESKCPALFYRGCVVAEVRDYRQSFPIFTCDTFHVLLKPTNQTLLADVNILTADGEWSAEDKLVLESQLVLATAEPLCLDPNPEVGMMSINQQHRRQLLNTAPIRRQAKKFSQVAVNRKRKTDQFTHNFGLELSDFINKYRQRPPRQQSVRRGVVSFTLPKKPSEVVPTVNLPNLELPELATPSEVNVEKYARKYEAPKESRDCIPQLIEEYILETDRVVNRGDTRVYHIKLSIFQRPSNSEYLGELYIHIQPQHLIACSGQQQQLFNTNPCDTNNSSTGIVGTSTGTTSSNVSTSQGTTITLQTQPSSQQQQQQIQQSQPQQQTLSLSNGSLLLVQPSGQISNLTMTTNAAGQQQLLATAAGTGTVGNTVGNAVSGAQSFTFASGGQTATIINQTGARTLGNTQQQAQQTGNIRVTMSALATQLASPPAILTTSNLPQSFNVAAAAGGNVAGTTVSTANAGTFSGSTGITTAGNKLIINNANQRVLNINTNPGTATSTAAVVAAALGGAIRRVSATGNSGTADGIQMQIQGLTASQNTASLPAGGNVGITADGGLRRTVVPDQLQIQSIASPGSDHSNASSVSLTSNGGGGGGSNTAGTVNGANANNIIFNNMSGLTALLANSASSAVAQPTLGTSITSGTSGDGTMQNTVSVVGATTVGLNFASLHGAMTSIPGLQNVQVQIPGLAQPISLSLSSTPSGGTTGVLNNTAANNAGQTTSLLVSVPVTNTTQVVNTINASGTSNILSGNSQTTQTVVLTNPQTSGSSLLSLPIGNLQLLLHPCPSTMPIVLMLIEIVSAQIVTSGMKGLGQQGIRTGTPLTVNTGQPGQQIQLLNFSQRPRTGQLPVVSCSGTTPITAKQLAARVAQHRQQLATAGGSTLKIATPISGV
uniref:Spt20-like SEP domain-containing protein n=1 Tax=Anopheles culicifacies TaxID=139723 RepID=A0A182M3P5_9DIPT